MLPNFKRTSQVKENELPAADVMEEVLAHEVKGEHVEEDVAHVLVRKGAREDRPAGK